jgi:drug/metabolite transporter (DMT)-like permease
MPIIYHNSSIRLFKILSLTLLALIAFAANSVLCRFALAGNSIDAAGFTVVRLLSAALVLLIIISFKNKFNNISKGNWTAGFLLFLYAITFSFAYISLDTGTGALILFAAVQITMILWSVIKGDKLQFLEWAGVIIAFTGFMYLVLPGVTAPSPVGFILMTIAGIAWGVYSLFGKFSNYPMFDTAYNFFRTIPFVLIIVIFTFNNWHYTFEGILLAIISGSITSGIGYILWYMALGGLTATQAAVVQLFVPVIAAFGGIIFLTESLTLRLLISAILILGGIFIVISGKKYNKNRNIKIQ